MKVIFSGAEDSGKSLMIARVAENLVYRNEKWAKITGKPRPIVSNMEFSERFHVFAAKHNVPVRHWRDIAELPSLTSCDLVMDEIGTYLDARTFKDLPLDVRLWLQQASKMGVDIYGTAQDFAQVDVSFRRLMTKDNGGLWHISKIIGSPRPNETRPPVARIWGVCSMRQLDPVAYDEESKKFAGQGLPRFFFITAHYCAFFDTTKRIPTSRPVPLKHIARPCADPNCEFKMYETHDGRIHRIFHV